jgi:diguanylate cyclase (GGDEF)-like protein
MTGFFNSQLDFILFFYGFAFILVGMVWVTVAGTHAGSEASLFRLLAAFAFIHGFGEWLDLTALEAGDNPMFAITRTAVMTVSFLCLLDSARQIVSVGRWVYVPLIALVIAAGGAYGFNAANAVARYVIGFPGALAVSLVYASLAKGLAGGEKFAAYVACVAFVLYGVAAGLIVPPAPFWPASVLNHVSFNREVGFPIQLARGILACWLAFSVWFIADRYNSGASSKYAAYRQRQFFYTAAAMSTILVTGWIFTDYLGSIHIWSLIVITPTTETVVNRVLGIVITFWVTLATLLHFLGREQAVREEIHLERATTDPLTGLFNRLKFNEALAYETARSNRYKTPLSVVLYDVDHFKSVNDTHGHPVGDKVLKQLSRVAKDMLRDTDLLARWGGEEFIILAPGSEGEMALDAAERLRVGFTNLIVDNGIKTTCSFGVAEYVEGDTAETLIARADAALYQAKLQGRNQVILASNLAGAHERALYG